MPPRKDRGFSFPKSARLRLRGEFVAVKEQGQGFAGGPLAASWIPRPEPVRTREGMRPALAKVGIAVSSKVGDAVVRSAVKRRLREAIRHELQELPAVDLVVVARPSAGTASVEEMRAWLRRAARRIGAQTEVVRP